MYHFSSTVCDLNLPMMHGRMPLRSTRFQKCNAYSTPISNGLYMQGPPRTTTRLGMNALVLKQIQNIGTIKARTNCAEGRRVTDAVGN